MNNSLKTFSDVRTPKTIKKDRSKTEVNFSMSTKNIGYDGELVNIKQKKHVKNEPFLNNLRYVQSIRFGTLPTWVMEFSKDNRFLATGGQD